MLLLLLFREDLLEHLVLLAQVVFMLRIGLLGPWRVLDRVPFRLRIIALLLLGWRNRWLHPRGRLLGRFAKSLGTSIFRHGLGRGWLTFNQVNRNIGWGCSSCNFLPLLGLSELPWRREL